MPNASKSSFKTLPESALSPNMPAPSGMSPVKVFRDESALLFSKAMAQTRMAVILSDAQVEDMPIVFANRAFIELTGYPEEEILGRNCRFLQGPDTDPETVAKMREALANEDVVVVEVRNYRKSGEPFWNALHLGPIYGEDGTLQYYFGSQWNVDDIHTARENEEHAQLLARELSHRVKNMFSIISAVVSMTADRHGADAMAEDINERIFALGRTYEITLRNSSDKMVDVQPLALAVLEAYASSNNHDVTVTGDGAMVPVSQSASIGLILHELSTNAVKYGALSTTRGAIAVTYSVTEDDGERVLALDWQETCEHPITPPDHVGTGSGIIETLLEANEGSIDWHWRPEGLHAVVRMLL